MESTGADSCLRISDVDDFVEYTHILFLTSVIGMHEQQLKNTCGSFLTMTISQSSIMQRTSVVQNTRISAMEIVGLVMEVCMPGPCIHPV
jgi:hypothetical protein